ncbi:hypothetical protein BDD12DRAFT_981957 [Trichophaea hybrida]|nr:hypothetical protein BDD12DRAFT_981957 [Trichophaea hybrida]
MLDMQDVRGWERDETVSHKRGLYGVEDRVKLRTPPPNEDGRCSKSESPGSSPQILGFERPASSAGISRSPHSALGKHPRSPSSSLPDASTCFEKADRYYHHIPLPHVGLPPPTLGSFATSTTTTNIHTLLPPIPRKLDHRPPIRAITAHPSMRDRSAGRAAISQSPDLGTARGPDDAACGRYGERVDALPTTSQGCAGARRDRVAECKTCTGVEGNV